jgi:ABC-2 type transport system ATP-binding protein
VRELAGGGATVLVSSHLLAEIEQVCTHVGIMSRGRLVLQGDRSVLADRGVTRVGIVTTPSCVGTAAEVLRGLGLGAPDVDGVRLVAPLGDLPPERVSAALVRGGVDLVGFEVRSSSLEQVFVELTGEGFDVAR